LATVNKGKNFMAAIGSIKTQVDSLASLRELANLINNPNDIIKAHETARKQMELTEAESAKAEEARSFIAQYDSLAKALQNSLDIHSKDKADHEKEYAAFKEECKTAYATIAAKHDSVAKREAQLVNDEKQFAEKQKAFEEACIKREKEISALTTAAEEQRLANISYKKELDVNFSDLEKERNSLKQKALSLRDQVANF